MIGQRDIAQRQLERLIELAERTNITLETILFSSGFHRGMLEPFVILEFPDPEDSDLLFSERTRETIISNDESGEISSYRELFEELRTVSLGPDSTLGYLRELLEKTFK